MSIFIAFAILMGACTFGSGKREVTPTTSATPPSLPAGACVTSLSDPSPSQGSDLVIVDSHLDNAPVDVTLHYRSGDRKHSATTNSKGHAESRFELGSPTAGFAIIVDVVVGTAPTTETCQTKFYPRNAGGLE